VSCQGDIVVSVVISYADKQRSAVFLWLLLVTAATPLFWLSLEQARWLVPEGWPAPPPALGFLAYPFMAISTLGVALALLVEIAGCRRWERALAGAGAFGVIFGTLPCVGPMLDASSRHGVTTISRNGAPVISALRAYQSDHGRYPERLSALTPDYLPSAPTTGLAAFPKFEYGSVEGREFSLWVHTEITLLDMSVCSYSSEPETEPSSWPTLKVNGWEYLVD
jgi:hypothetical protein